MARPTDYDPETHPRADGAVTEPAIGAVEQAEQTHLRVALGVIVSVEGSQPTITPIGCEADEAIEILRAVVRGIDNVGGMTKQ